MNQLKKEKNSNQVHPALFIIAIIVCSVCGVVVGEYSSDWINYSYTNVKYIKEKEEYFKEPELSDSERSLLLDIIGINDGVSNQNLSNFQIQNYLINIIGELNLSDLEAKDMLIYSYALNHNMVVNCNNGNNCKAIKIVDAKEIGKKYGFSEEEVDRLYYPNRKNENYYLYNINNEIVSGKVAHNISITTGIKSVDITDQLLILDSNNTYINKIINYTFYLNEDNSYYLASISVK